MICKTMDAIRPRIDITSPAIAIPRPVCCSGFFLICDRGCYELFCN